MKIVNLLPEWYLRAQRERCSLRIRLLLMLVLGGVMVGWTFVGRGQVRQLQHQRDALVRQGEIVHSLGGDLQRAENDIRRLENLQLAYRDLGTTVPMSAVLQQIPNNMTVGMALSRATIDVRAEPVRNSGMVGDPRNPPRYHNIARLNLVGLAPNDVLIAQLIGRISANPLFTDVSLNFTRTETLREYSVRRFEIQMQVDLDRLATEDPTNPGGPSDVPPPAPHMQSASPSEAQHAS